METNPDACSDFFKIHPDCDEYKARAEVELNAFLDLRTIELRDHIAIEALKAVMAERQLHSSTIDSHAKFAYMVADAMLEARKKDLELKDYEIAFNEINELAEFIKVLSGFVQNDFDRMIADGHATAASIREAYDSAQHNFDFAVTELTRHRSAVLRIIYNAQAKAEKKERAAK